MARRGFLASVVVALVASLTGCYGSTEPATQVKSTSAVLNGYGTTNQGAASVRFEYWRTGSPSVRLHTPPRSIPGGVTGPFSQPVQDLQSGTAYSFRLCGTDSGGTVCAQPLRFDTPPRDRVDGTASSSAFTFKIHVSSGPSGEDVQGLVDATNAQGQRLRATPTCLIVTGRTAIVGFYGFVESGSEFPEEVRATAKIVDGDVAGQDSLNLDPGDTDCASYQPGASTVHGDIDVVDSDP